MFERRIALQTIFFSFKFLISGDLMSLYKTKCDNDYKHLNRREASGFIKLFMRSSFFIVI